MANWKEWPVYRSGTGSFVGWVRAEWKYLGYAMAERDYHLRPGQFYLGTLS